MEASSYPPSRVPSIEQIRDNGFFLPYVTTLKRIFAEILGWPETQTLDWVEQRLQHDWFRHFFGHTMPNEDAAPVIVPIALKNQLVSHHISTVHIHHEIEDVLVGIGDKYYMHPDTDPDYDWQRARQKIADIIKKYEMQVA